MEYELIKNHLYLPTFIRMYNDELVEELSKIMHNETLCIHEDCNWDGMNNTIIKNYSKDINYEIGDMYILISRDVYEDKKEIEIFLWKLISTLLDDAKTKWL